MISASPNRLTGVGIIRELYGTTKQDRRKARRHLVESHLRRLLAAGYIRQSPMGIYNLVDACLPLAARKKMAVEPVVTPPLPPFAGEGI